ncbi:MAG: hypothetical protein E7342_03165 [Clostridiales bacterium]|nr:hypothetical protein [Clostridiales bacterium]
MRKFIKLFGFVYKYSYVVSFLLGLVCMIFYQQIMHVFSYVAGGLMGFFALCALIASFLKVTKKEKKPFLVAAFLVAVILSVLFVIEREESITIIAVIWGVYGLLKGGKEVAKVVEEIQEKRSFISSLIQAIFTLTISTILLLEPIAHHVERHIILLGLEFIIIPLISLDNKKEYPFNKIFNLTEEENEYLKDKFETKFPKLKKKK